MQIRSAGIDLGKQGSGPKKAGDSVLLCMKPKTALTLILSRNPVEDHKRAPSGRLSWLK
jgi:hypothetical protein